MSKLEPRAVELGLQPLPAELVGDLGAHLLTRRELDLQVESVDAHALVDVGAEEHLDPLVLRVPTRDVLEALDIEVAAELAVDHMQDVAVELRRHAARVVVRRLEPRWVLDEIGAEQQGLAGPSSPWRAERKPARCSPVRLPIDEPRNAKSRRLPSGSQTRLRSKSPTTPCTSIPGYSSAIAAAASRRACSDTSNGTNRRRCPASTIASSRRRVFSDDPEPGSTSVFAAVSVATSSARSARMIRSRLVR